MTNPARLATAGAFLAAVAAAVLVVGCSSSAGTAVPATGGPVSEIPTSAPFPSTDPTDDTTETTDDTGTDDTATDDTTTDDTTTTEETGGGDGPAETADARAGLAAWLEANRPATPETSTDIPGCPLISREAAQAAVEGIGVTEQLEEWTSEVEWDEFEDIAPDLLGVSCEAESVVEDSDVEVGMAAVDLGGRVGLDEFLSGTGLPDGESVTISSMPNGEATALCMDDGCLLVWFDGSHLLVAAYLAGLDAPAVDQVTALFEELGPQALTTLAG